MRLNQVTVPASHMAASVDFYKRLGLIQIVAGDDYARFVCPDGDATFSIHRVATVATCEAPVVYFECDDLDERVSELKRAGLVFDSDPADQRWLWREAHLRDPSGNEICLFHAGDNRLNPPWRLPLPEQPPSS